MSTPHDGLPPLTRYPVPPREPTSTSVEPFDPATLHFAYTIVSKDDPPWQPVRVFDTGHKTYIQFPPALAASEAPALFVRATPGGALQLVNYRVHTTDQGTYYIVDRLFEQDRSAFAPGGLAPASPPNRAPGHVRLGAFLYVCP